jgi:hypothetical protein
MNDSHANSGHVELSGTDEIEADCQGFTPVNGDFTVSAITLPTARGGTGYRGDDAFLATITFKEGVYYPIPFTAITPATGAALGWRD